MASDFPLTQNSRVYREFLIVFFWSIRRQYVKSKINKNTVVKKTLYDCQFQFSNLSPQWIGNNNVYCVSRNLQARGRGRKEDSSYTVLQVEGSGVAERETVNEFREKMMGKAIEKIQKLDQAEYERKVGSESAQLCKMILDYQKQNQKSFIILNDIISLYSQKYVDTPY